MHKRGGHSMCTRSSAVTHPWSKWIRHDVQNTDGEILWSVAFRFLKLVNAENLLFLTCRNIMQEFDVTINSAPESVQLSCKHVMKVFIENQQQCDAGLQFRLHYGLIHPQFMSEL
jgi:hypothetical protein